MKREIKFRAWMTKDKKMVEISDLHFVTGIFQAKAWEGMEKHFVSDMGYISANWGEHGNPIMQFTGLHDKNGKEIFEGDIVKCNKNIPEKYDNHGRKGEVVYRNKEAQFVVENEYGFAITSLYVFGIARGEVSCLEVIGNVFENPELIGK